MRNATPPSQTTPWIWLLTKRKMTPAPSRRRGGRGVKAGSVRADCAGAPRRRCPAAARQAARQPLRTRLPSGKSNVRGAKGPGVDTGRPGFHGLGAQGWAALGRSLGGAAGAIARCTSPPSCSESGRTQGGEPSPEPTRGRQSGCLRAPGSPSAQPHWCQRSCWHLKDCLHKGMFQKDCPHLQFLSFSLLNNGQWISFSPSFVSFLPPQE